MSRPVRPIAAITVGLLLLLAACGGDGGGSGDEAGAGTSTPPLPAPTSTTTTVAAAPLDCAALLTPDEFAAIIGRPMEDSNASAAFCSYGADDFNTPFTIGVHVATADLCTTDQQASDGTIEGLGDASFYIEGAGGSAGVHVLTGDRCVVFTSGAGERDPDLYEVDTANSEAVARIVVPRLG